MTDYRRSETAYVHFTLPGAPSSALAASDFAIFRGVTKRSSTAGFTLTNVDGTVGAYSLAIDLTDDTDAGFYLQNVEYQVRFDTAKTVGATALDGVFIDSLSIENTTAMQAEASAGRYISVKDGAFELQEKVYDLIRYDLATEKSLVAIMNAVSQGYLNNKTVIDQIKAIAAHATYGNSALQVLIAAIKAVTDAHTPQTGDSYPIVSSGTHGNAALKVLIDALSGTELLSTTVASRTSGTVYVLNAGAPDDNAYDGSLVIFIDQSTPTQVMRAAAADSASWDAGTLTLTLGADPAIFIPAAGDTIRIYAKGTASVVGGDATLANQTAMINTLTSILDKVVKGHIATYLTNPTKHSPLPLIQGVDYDDVARRKLRWNVNGLVNDLTTADSYAFDVWNIDAPTSILGTSPTAGTIENPGLATQAIALTVPKTAYATLDKKQNLRFRLRVTLNSGEVYTPDDGIGKLELL